MKIDELINTKKEVIDFFKKANIVITKEEEEKIEFADFGLNNFRESGLSILTYVNTDRVCAKELVMLPKQTCPEHRHPNFEDQLGKEETFRCRWGKVYLYVEGKETKDIKAVYPRDGEYTVFHEVVIKPGEQYTIMPNIKHWFQAGEQGAIVSEFSTKSTDELDVFTDKKIIR